MHALARARQPRDRTLSIPLNFQHVAARAHVAPPRRTRVVRARRKFSLRKYVTCGSSSIKLGALAQPLIFC